MSHQVHICENGAEAASDDNDNDVAQRNRKKVEPGRWNSWLSYIDVRRLWSKTDQIKPLSRDASARDVPGDVDWTDDEVADGEACSVPYYIPSDDEKSMLRKLRLLGHFDKTIFDAICKYIKPCEFSANEYLFRAGDSNNNIYVVKSGSVRVQLLDPETNEEHCINIAKDGDCVHSLMDMLDPEASKHVSAVAMESTKLLQLPASALLEVLEPHPALLVHSVQMIMVRLEHVTLMALNRCLGLSQELIVLDTSNPVDVTDGEDGQPTIDDLAKLLGLENKNILMGKYNVLDVPQGEKLIEQCNEVCDLYFVISGVFEVVHHQVQIVDSGTKSVERILYTAEAGELIGSLSIFTAEPTQFTYRAKTNSRVFHITKSDFDDITKQEPKLVISCSRKIVQRLTPLVRQMDFALDWMLIKGDEILYRRGDESYFVYIILRGRLRSTETLDGKELIREYGRGELVGLKEVLKREKRCRTMTAKRDTELAMIPADLMNFLTMKYPQVGIRLIQLMGQQMQPSSAKRLISVSEDQNAVFHPTIDNLATVAILSASGKVSLSNFTTELKCALSNFGSTLHLNSKSSEIQPLLKPTDVLREYRMFSKLSELEDSHYFVLYECDRNLKATEWTKYCLRQADCILVVAMADDDPALGSLEEDMERLNIGKLTQKKLVLLHREDGPKPHNTSKWLELRKWCSSHHHVRCPKHVFTTTPSGDNNARKPDRMSDVSRLARFLTGTSIGLVLGGGGARGCAHVGVIRALMEAGIPIDMIGGTSIGSMMGALWADETDVEKFGKHASDWCRRMGQTWRLIIDITIPATSVTSGSAFNKLVGTMFGDRDIEDLWIPYFCITTNLSESTMRQHMRGSLWRYSRSSMTLPGLLPPLCDPKDGHLLVDGGFVNNLPADVMMEIGARTIIAVDVGSKGQKELLNYGDSIRGWRPLWHRVWPWAGPAKVPSLYDIQMRLAGMSSVRQLQQVIDNSDVHYMRPEIDGYGLLQFGSFDEIAEAGYKRARGDIQEWETAGEIGNFFPDKSQDKFVSKVNKGDLGDMLVCIDNLVTKMSAGTVASAPSIKCADVRNIIDNVSSHPPLTHASVDIQLEPVSSPVIPDSSIFGLIPVTREPPIFGLKPKERFGRPILSLR